MLKNVPYAGENPLGHARVQDALAEAEAQLAGRGRVLIRASGTEPLIRVMAEAEDKALVAETVERLARLIAAVAAEEGGDERPRADLRRIGFRRREPESRPTSRPSPPSAPSP